MSFTQCYQLSGSPADEAWQDLQKMGVVSIHMQSPAADDTSIRMATNELIVFYEDFWNDSGKRKAAANFVAGLAERYQVSFDLLAESARSYALLQCYTDDADPYSPNSIRVLGSVRGRRARALLADLQQRPSGMAQNDIAEALHAHYAAVSSQE